MTPFLAIHVATLGFHCHGQWHFSFIKQQNSSDVNSKDALLPQMHLFHHVCPSQTKCVTFPHAFPKMPASFQPPIDGV